ncbi:MAG: flagellar biosynthetic protein FliR [Spirochaetota bacterium]|nr:flagellar biosynthetic protein FliR [Spirochaetota bacterium]
MWVEFLIGKFQFFLLIMMRMFGMIAVAPFFSSVLIPMRVKATLALTITLVIFPILSEQLPMKIPQNFVDYILLVINELAIGLSIGLVVSIIFATFQLAGQFFSIQMGFGISEVFDPLSQIHVPLVGQFLALIGILIFFLVGGHILLIEGVFESYFKLPVLDIMNDSKPLMDLMIEVFNDMFVTALKISLPIIGTLFIVTLSMGLLAKFAPQMNILMLGFPIYITIGFVMLILLMSFILENGRSIMDKYLDRILQLV